MVCAGYFFLLLFVGREYGVIDVLFDFCGGGLICVCLCFRKKKIMVAGERDWEQAFTFLGRAFFFFFRELLYGFLE